MAMAQLDTGSPSVRQIQGFIKDKQEVQVKLITGELLVGKLLWQDIACLCLAEREGASTLIWRQAVAYLKPQR
jgi:host factor-I protein